MAFDLQHLADATITVPSQTRPNAPVQRLLDLLRDAEEVRTFSHAFNDQAIRVVLERVTAGEQRFSGVISPGAIAHWRRTTDSGNDSYRCVPNRTRQSGCEPMVCHLR